MHEGTSQARAQASLTWLKLLTIVAPVAFLAVVTYLLRGPAHEQLHHMPSVLYILGAMAVAVTAFSVVVFGIIGRVERRVIEQNEELLERNEDMAALLAVGQAASSSVQLADVLDAALDAIVSVTSAEDAEVWTVDGGGDLVLERVRGPDADAFRARSRLKMGEGLPGVAADRQEVVSIHELTSEPRFVRPAVTALGFETFCAFPLLRSERCVGVLGVAARSRAALASESEHTLLEGIGEQLAVAIENARLHAQVLDRAVLEERERLAHELHDSLAQVLGYVNTQTLAIKRLLTSGRGDEAERQVGEMEAAARKVYTDVREAILGLRASQGELLPSLDAYLTDYGRMTGLRTRLQVTEGFETLRLAPRVEIQLMRIVQEALSNIRKHSEAGTATVALDAAEDTVSITVADDGRGFDVDHPVRTGWPHFGLQTMRERAQAIGGTLEIVSDATSGTSVVVRLPAAMEAGKERRASPARR